MLLNEQKNHNITLNRSYITLKIKIRRLCGIIPFQFPPFAFHDYLGHFIAILAGHMGQNGINDARLHLPIGILEAGFDEVAVEVRFEVFVFDYFALVGAFKVFHGDAWAFHAVLVVLGVHGLFFIGQGESLKQKDT